MITGLELPLLTLALLVAASFVAGWVDAVVGGGGLIQLPALLIGLPSDTPVATIAGTNKIPSLVGTLTAGATYLRSIRVDWGLAWPLLLMAAAGSWTGAQLTHFLPRQHFTPLVLFAVVSVGLYTWRTPHLGLHSAVKHTGNDARLRMAAIGLVVGAWDGFIGPGTGTFFVIALVSVIGHDFLASSALAKLANLTTNASAIVAFAITGNLLWGLGLAMGVANLTGGFLGARTALTRGNGFVRQVFLMVVGALALKLAWDTWVSYVG
ncbi:sulfite exporter TauE/SafE family protein [Micropruina sp.]|uniref:sulfite exporter TauE/SafE family protein n=1 Tax=Micropruina sp. TaxID=2737536 RepID=UPI0039E6ECC3